MVLPAKYAEVIRGMAAGGGGGESSPEVHIHQNISAWDSIDARRALMGNNGAVFEAVKAALRDFKR